MTSDDSTAKPAVEMPEVARFGTLDPGTVVGEYRVLDKVGEGTFGEVYQGVHPLIGKTVAIKVLSAQFSRLPEMVSRFVEEARAVNKIRHPNIVDIFAFGRLPDDRSYYVMEYLDGRALDAFLDERGVVEPEQVVTLLTGIARALDAAHAAGIVHRDLKPENIVLIRDPERGLVPKLLDFGVAKLIDENVQHRTLRGAPIGTPAYMSPEQCQGSEIDHRSDIYALGILAHRMLTGAVPFDDESTLALMTSHVKDQPPRISELRPELPALLDAPVLAMLAKNPSDRPPSALAAVVDLAVAVRNAGFNVAIPNARPSLPDDDGMGAPRQQQLRSSRTSAGVVSADLTRGNELKGGKRIGYVVAAAAVIALLAFVSARRDPEVPPAGTRTAESERAPTPAPLPVAPPPGTAPAATASASNPASAAQTDSVKVEIQTSPPGAEIVRGRERLGRSPVTIQLKHGEQRVALRLLTYGYEEAVLRLVPDRDQQHNVTLVPRKRQNAAKPEPPRRSRQQLEF